MNETQLDQTPSELLIDPTSIHVTPAVLEVFLSNTCNLSCTYCSVKFSSKILAESKKYKNQENFNKKYLGDPDLNLSPTEIEEYKNLLLNWLKNNGSKLRRFHLLGGEPFYTKEFSEFVNIWNEFPNPNLILNVISNVNVHPTIWKKHIDLITELVLNNKIEGFDITASLDCWGPQQEYVRSGFKCSIAEENILYYLSKPSVKYLNINSTHSLMSIPYYYKLIEKKIEWEEKFKKPVRLYGELVMSDHVAADILGGEFYEPYVKKVMQLHPSITWDDQQSLKNFLGLIGSINNTLPELDKINEFIDVYSELDFRRNTNWKLVYPEIDNEIRKYLK
jgi:hypothetical protein